MFLDDYGIVGWDLRFRFRVENWQFYLIGLSDTFIGFES